MENTEERIQYKSKSFEDLIVWQKAHEFALLTYEVSQAFPKEERYGLTSQFRRAAVSVAANIAEGFKKKGEKDKIRFYNISQGSLEECKYYLILSRDLNYSTDDKMKGLSDEISKLLTSYIKSIQNNSNY